MNDVRLDPQQVPARAELLLAAELGEDAPGRPIYTRLEPDSDVDGEPTARIKVGAMLTRRLTAAEATETPSGAAYGNPLRGRPERAPSVPIGSAVLARTDAADARGWRVLMHRAAAIVLFHNHPSADPTPSVDDIALTERLQQAGILMGIEVLDHMVLADTRYCSFKEMGRL